MQQKGLAHGYSTLWILAFNRVVQSARGFEAQGLPFEEIPVDILSGEQFTPDYEEVNAERVVPMLVHDGHALFQSLAIVEYLEDLQPEPRLLPQGAKERAYARSLALATVADAHPLITPRVRNHLGQGFSADVHALQNWSKHWTTEGAATYERLFARQLPAPFALGAEPGLADICIAGHAIGAHFFKVELTAFPAVAHLAEHCFALPAFATSHPFEQPGYKATPARR